MYGTTATYTQGTMVFDYDPQFSALTPDTALISFSPCNDYVPMPRSTLWVDQLAFTGFVGIDDKATSDKEVLVYPNPATSAVSIITQNKNAEAVNIYDQNGKLITLASLVNRTAKIDMHSYPGGIYLYSITDKNNAVINAGKFCIEK